MSHVFTLFMSFDQATPSKDYDLDKLKQEYLETMCDFVSMNLDSDGKMLELLTGKPRRVQPTSNVGHVINTPTKTGKSVAEVDPIQVERISMSIKAIVKSNPDLFYHLETPKKSLCHSLFENYKAKLLDDRVESAILWICSQQVYTHDNNSFLQPRFLQIWFRYYFDYCRLPEFDYQSSVEILNQTLDDTRILCEKGLVNFDDLAMVSISEYSSLIKFVVSQKNSEAMQVRQVYYKIKNLLFGTRKACIVTNRPSKLFSVLFLGIHKLEKQYQEEVPINLIRYSIIYACFLHLNPRYKLKSFTILGVQKLLIAKMKLM